MNVTKCNKLLQYVNTQVGLVFIWFLAFTHAVQASPCVEVFSSEHISKDVQKSFTSLAQQVWQYCPDPLKADQKYVIHLVDYIESKKKQPFVIQSPLQLDHFQGSLSFKVEKKQGNDLLWRRVLQRHMNYSDMFQPFPLVRQSVFEQMFRQKQGLSQLKLGKEELRKRFFLKSLQQVFFETKYLQQKFTIQQVPS